MIVPLIQQPVDQIGIVVPDLERAMICHQAPGRSWAVVEIGPDHPLVNHYRGQACDGSWLMATSEAELPSIELIQPLRGPSIHHDWVEQRGYGLHHLGVIVSSLTEAIDRMDEAGYEPIQVVGGFGAHHDGALAYFDTATELGYLIEAVQRPLADFETALDEETVAA